MKPAVLVIAAGLLLLNCVPTEAPPDAGVTPPHDAGPEGSDAGADASVPDAGIDAGRPDAGPVDAGTPGWRKVFETPPGRSNHRAFWWAPTRDTRVLSGNHATGPIQDFWSWSGTQWTQTPLTEAQCPERKNAAVALDDVNQRLYVFGGTWSGYPRDGGPYTVRVLGDFRSWDGTTWRDEAGDGGSPSARGGAAMGYDSERKQLVLFGGSDNQTASGETWIHDGEAWALRSFDAGTAVPSARFNMHLVFDQARKRLVMFGGQTNNAFNAAINHQDTWEWDGQSWLDVTGAAPAPPGRGHASMTYDPSRQKVVMLGGSRHFSPTPPGSELEDFWEWNGTQWTEVPVTGRRPGPRSAATLSFDPDLGRLILYGGFNGTADLNELFELNGQVWESRTQVPLPRTAGAFAQRGPNGEAMLMGGYVTAGSRYLGDTWRWKDGKWVELFGTRPSPRSDASLAYHGADLLLVGGQSATGYSGDNWGLGQGATSWITIPGPTPRSQAAMAHDPKRNITVVFGGRNAAGRLADTWVFNGSSWSQLTTATTPSARRDATLLFDPARQQLVLLGGSRTGTTGGTVILNDAWTFDGANWQELVGVTAAPSPRLWNALAFDSIGRLWSFGGYDGAKLYDDASRFENGAWTPAAPAGPAARFGARLLDVGDKWLLQFGSTSDFARNWKDFGDVWELAPR